MQSEDLPHSSGIKTLSQSSNRWSMSRRKTCPTNRRLRLVYVALSAFFDKSEDFPLIGLQAFQTTSNVGRLKMPEETGGI